MDDAKRFVRYLVPGAVFGVQIAVLLWVIGPDWLEPKLVALAKENGIGFVVAGLLGSGALGFVFSVVHHELHWRPWLSTIDHTECIQRLIRANRLRVYVLDSTGACSEITADRIDRRLAWTILSSVWHGALLEAPIQSAEAKAAQLSDTAHSLGTARVAAIAALLTAGVVALRVADPTSPVAPVVWAPRGVVALLWGFGAVSFFWYAYLRTGAIAQGMIEQVFADAAFRKGAFEVRVPGGVNPGLGHRYL